MKEIKLHGGNVAFCDSEDFDFLSKFSWYETPKGHRTTTYARARVKEQNKSVITSMHRLLLGLKTNDGTIVDHINRNGLDNRKSNLRITDYSTNASNRGKSTNNTSGYKGVYYRRDRGTWRGDAMFHKKLYSTRSYRCKHACARAYNELVVELRGDGAWVNDVEGCDCSECSKYLR